MRPVTGEQPTSEVDAFVARWRAADGTELANAQSFVRELAELLGLEPPHPAREDTRDNAYVFERRVTLARGDGTSGEGRIDCYRRGCFVLEAKKIRAGAATRGFDDALDVHGRPPEHQAASPVKVSGPAARSGCGVTTASPGSAHPGIQGEAGSR